VSDELNGVTTGADGKARPKVVSTFHDLTQAKLENAQSRIYLGIHWRFDADEGIKTGDAVANYVFAHFLQPNVKNGGGHHNPDPGNGPRLNATLTQCDSQQLPKATITSRSATMAVNTTSNQLTDMAFEKIGLTTTTISSSTTIKKVQRELDPPGANAIAQNVRGVLNLKTL
jgi:hypothetical protein